MCRLVVTEFFSVTCVSGDCWNFYHWPRPSVSRLSVQWNKEPPLNPSIPQCRDVRRVSGCVLVWPTDAEKRQPLSTICGRSSRNAVVSSDKVMSWSFCSNLAYHRPRGWRLSASGDLIKAPPPWTSPHITEIWYRGFIRHPCYFLR